MVRSPVHYLGFQAKRDNGVRDLEIFNLSLVQNVFSTAQQRWSDMWWSDHEMKDTDLLKLYCLRYSNMH